MTSVADRARAAWANHAGKMGKYLSASVAATLMSAATYAAMFYPRLLGAKASSLVASAAGALVNYFVNRHWTWGQRGRPAFRAEVIPYWRTVVFVAVAAAIVTGGANAVARDMTDSRAARTAVNLAAYLTTYAVAFLVKYRQFDRLFTRHSTPAADPSADDARHQDSPGEEPASFVGGQPALRPSRTPSPVD